MHRQLAGKRGDPVVGLVAGQFDQHANLAGAVDIAGDHAGIHGVTGETAHVDVLADSSDLVGLLLGHSAGGAGERQGQQGVEIGRVVLKHDPGNSVDESLESSFLATKSVSELTSTTAQPVP